MFNAFEENGFAKKIDCAGCEDGNDGFEFFMYENDACPCDFYIRPTFGGRPIMAEIPLGFGEYVVHYGDSAKLASNDDKFKTAAEECGLLAFFDKVHDHLFEIYKGFHENKERLFLFGEYREDDGLIRFHSAAFSWEDEPLDASAWSLRFGEVANKIGEKLGRFIVLPEVLDPASCECESEGSFCGDVMEMIDMGCFRFHEDGVMGFHVWCLFQSDGETYGDWWFPVSYISERSDRSVDVNRCDLTKWSIANEQ